MQTVGIFYSVNKKLNIGSFCSELKKFSLFSALKNNERSRKAEKTTGTH